MRRVEELFAEAMRRHGITPPDRIIADGKLHRFSTNGKNNDDSGWLVLHADGPVPAGAFGDWRQGGKAIPWRADLGRTLTPTESAELARRIEAARRQAEEERQQRAERAATVAEMIWREARPAGVDHPYLVRKNVKPVASLREMDAEILAQRLGYTPKNKGEPLQGRILIAPVRVDGALATLEMIDEQGRKSALAGGAKRAGCWATGPLPERGRVVLAEGVATALSIAEALGEPVAAALSVGNLAAAGEAIRAARPGIELVIAADLDKTGHPHPEAIRAAEALRCPLLSPPADLLPGTDFNDLHAARGLEAVRECFAGVEALTAPMSREEALSLAREALMPEAKPDTPYPVDALGPLADVAVEIAHGMQCDVALAGQSVLAAAALLAQSVANVRTLDGAEKPLSLYCLTIASSGDGKDSADRIALRPLNEWQREAARAHEAACKRAKESGDDPPAEPYRVTADITLEGLRRAFAVGMPSQGIFSTEGGVLLAGHAMLPENRIKTAAALCGLWDRGHLSVARAGAGRLERYGVRLSVHLMAQPAAVLESLADQSLAGIGFWPRFLLAWPAPLPPRKYRPFRPSESPAVIGYWERCARLLTHPQLADNDTLPVLEMDEVARRTLANFFEHCEHEARLGDLQAVKPFALRGAELAARIAGVQAVFAGEEGIDARAIERGIALVRYSIRQWLAALEDGRADPVAQHAMTLYRWLLEQDMAPRPGDILRLGPAPLRSKSRRDAAIERLEAAGLVTFAGGVVEANRAPLHLRKRPPANPANSAKTRTNTGVRGFANVCESCERDQAHSQDSQAFANAEIKQPCGFSQHSQLSQTPQARIAATTHMPDAERY